MKAALPLSNRDSCDCRELRTAVARPGRPCRRAAWSAVRLGGLCVRPRLTARVPVALLAAWLAILCGAAGWIPCACPHRAGNNPARSREHCYHGQLGQETGRAALTRGPHCQRCLDNAGRRAFLREGRSALSPLLWESRSVPVEARTLSALVPPTRKVLAVVGSLHLRNTVLRL